MKKIISAIIVVVMLTAVITTFVSADNEYVSPGNIIVPYTKGDGIVIDGTLDQGEWSETNKIVLDATNLVSWSTPYEGPIDYYYSWGDKGLYMAADVYDPLMGTAGSQGGEAGGAGLSTRFQIALNPAGIIKDYNGLFFSFCPVIDSDVVDGYKHNWETSDDACTLIDHEDYLGKYTYKYDGDNIIGWYMEVLLPWSLIATPDRYADIDDEYYDEITLDKFNPKDENRARAFITATICYVQLPGTATGRTCTDGVVTWEVDSYDVVLFMALEDELTRDTVTEYFTLAVTDAPTDDPGAVTDPKETDAPAKDTEPAKETDAPKDDTKAPTTKAPATDPGEQKSNAGLIIGIIVGVVVVAAVVVVVIVMSKKKK